MSDTTSESSLPPCGSCGGPMADMGTQSGGGWACDGRSHFQEGCAQGCTGFNQSAGWQRYCCSSCDFDFCGGCAQRANLVAASEPVEDDENGDWSDSDDHQSFQISESEASSVCSITQQRTLLVLCWKSREGSTTLAALPADVIRTVGKMLRIAPGTFLTRLTWSQGGGDGPFLHLKRSGAPGSIEGVAVANSTKSEPSAVVGSRFMINDPVWSHPHRVEWQPASNQRKAFPGGRPQIANIEFSLCGRAFRGWCCYNHSPPVGFFGWRKNESDLRGWTPPTAPNRLAIEEAMDKLEWHLEP